MIGEGVPRKVTFLTTLFGQGGAETQIMRISRELKDRGWEVHVISMLEPVGYQRELAEHGIPLSSLSMQRGLPDPRAVFRLVRVLRETRPDVLTTFCFHANVLGAMAGRLAGVPAIVTSIRNELFGSRQREWAERAVGMFRFNDVLTTNSELVARSLVARNIVSKDRLRVIHNGIEVDEPDFSVDQVREVRAELKVAPDDFLWLAVGNLREQKDYPNLLRAMRFLLNEGAGTVKLRIAGFGPYEDEVRAHIQELELYDDVHLLGRRDDVPLLLKAADAFVLSSAWEGLPNVVMEAMLSGVPVVATDVGGVAELVEDEVSGILVEPHSSKKLAEAMTRLMEYSAVRRSEMGAAGRDHIVANFSVDKITDRWEALLLELMPAETHQEGVT